MKNVIVYQMGKVASSALTDALIRAGVNAYQSHYLDNKTLCQIMNKIERPSLRGDEIHHLLGQLEQNFRLFFLLKRYQIGSVSVPEKLHVITLARDPIDWYFANLAQNFFIYEPGIVKWCNANVEKSATSNDLTSVHLGFFLESVIRRFSQSIPVMLQSSRSIIQDLNREARQTAAPNDQLEAAINEQVMLLLRPHFWFDAHIKPVFDVDVMGLEFVDGQGCSFFENNYMKLMMIRYEDLEINMDRLREFCGLVKFRLRRVNDSSEKPFYKEIEKARTAITFPRSFLQLYYSSRYCKKYYAR